MTIYYVAQTAAGNGNGLTYANRMSVSTHNSSTFSANDVIRFCAGQITSGVVVPSSGSPGNPILYTRYTSDPGFFRNYYTSYGSISGQNVGHISVDNLDFRNGRNGITFRDCNNITATRNYIENMEAHGISIGHSDWVTVGGAPGQGNEVFYAGDGVGGSDYGFGRTTNLVLSYNKGIGDPSGYGSDGTTVQMCANVLVEYNLFSDHRAGYPIGEDGIDVKGSTDVIIRCNVTCNNRFGGFKANANKSSSATYSCYRVVMCHNYACDNRSNTTVSGGDENEVHSDIYIWGNVLSKPYEQHGASIGTQGENVHFYNNTLYEVIASDKANLITSRGSDFYIKNNIFSRLNSTRQVWNRANEAGVDIDNNLYYNAGGSSQIYWNGSWQSASNVDSNAVVANPLLTNPENGNFTLQAGSPAINAGTNVSAVSIPNIVVQGKTYSFTFDDVLASDTDFSAFPPVVKIVKQSTLTSPVIGAYAYATGAEPGDPTPPPDPDPDPDPPPAGDTNTTIENSGRIDSNNATGSLAYNHPGGPMVVFMRNTSGASAASFNGQNLPLVDSAVGLGDNDWPYVRLFFIDNIAAANSSIQVSSGDAIFVLSLSHCTIRDWSLARVGGGADTISDTVLSSENDLVLSFAAWRNSNQDVSSYMYQTRLIDDTSPNRIALDSKVGSETSTVAGFSLVPGGSSSNGLSTYTVSFESSVETPITTRYPVYSICPNNGGVDQKTGSPSISISNNVATLSVAQTGNIGQGCRITYDTNKVCFISTVIASDTFGVRSITGDNVDDTTTSTPVVSISHEFGSISAAFAGASDANHLNTLDMVTNQYLLHFPCYRDHVGNLPDAPVTYQNYITSEAFPISVYTPTHCIINQRPTGALEVNYRIKSETANTHPVSINGLAWLMVDGIEIEQSGDGAGTYNNGVGWQNATGKVSIRNSIIYSKVASPAGNSYGVSLWSFAGNCELEIINTGISNFSSRGIEVYNNTAHNVAFKLNSTTIYSPIGTSGIVLHKGDAGSVFTARVLNSLLLGNTTDVELSGAQSAGIDIEISRSIDSNGSIAAADPSAVGCLGDRTATDNESPGAGNWVVFENITTLPYDLRLADVHEINDAQRMHQSTQGAGLTMPNSDFRGTKRPQGIYFDCGFHEVLFQEVPPPPPPPDTLPPSKDPDPTSPEPKRGCQYFKDSDGSFKPMTPAIDLLKNEVQIDPEKSLLIFTDTSVASGQKEKSVSVKDLFYMRPYTVLCRDVGHGGQRVLETERLPATIFRAGFQGSADFVQTVAQTLTDEATVAWDIAKGGTGILLLGGNRTISFSGAIAGKKYVLIAKQDATGGRTLAYSSGFKFPGGTSPTVTATANAVSVLEFVAESSTVLHCISTQLDSK